MNEQNQTVKIQIKDTLEKQILKDTLADSKFSNKETLKRIFDIGLSFVGMHVAPRCPRLTKNMEMWLDEKENSNTDRTL